ncbi:helix-turn-helix domain-containing protein [Anabaena sp. FACHB-1237]|uniref:response regulator transcription factor n=1 Tax=Anabaena sp. FACHB-1237 TaxID=2692769 RepID=UPI001680F14C|nr:helix-turn-helix domain-containing protein [Anabaena sp. FACHB-1237]MBD2138597.1 helix-turn-helix domain-containing protein [Anabaena sp. FACHB-1237]
MNAQKKILVIENDINTRNLVLDALISKGYFAIAAEDGILGLKLAQEYAPDLVVCDVLIPDIDGFTVLSNLREDPLTAIIPFIFFSASNTQETVRKAMDLGADDYLSKPATIDASVDELLRSIAIRLQKQDLFKNWYTMKAMNSKQTENIKTNTVSSLSIFPNIPHFKNVFEYIEAHYHEGITLSDVAAAVGYSSPYLTHQVAKQTGESVNAWIVKRRMVAALSLLENTDQTIEDIAIKLGYQNVCHFSRQFRQHHGLSPNNWRKKHQLISNNGNNKLHSMIKPLQLANV